ncbi:hypothetical protein MYXO_01937 [Myxococcaceae bacterium]|nr:hypothetical protein MYXO_01937 [Myxococcaceae bacterium]
MCQYRLAILRGMLFTVALAGPVWSGEISHQGHGVVKEVDAAAGTVTIDHDEIPGLMMGMTMAFSVSDPKLLDGIAPKQVVDFQLRDENGRYVVTEIQPVAGGAGPDAHGHMEGHAAEGRCAGMAGDRPACSHEMAPTGCCGATTR